jgi:aminoglycoside 3-N-acetyltransferase I
MHADSQIRRLTADDVDLLRQLNAVFAAAFDDEHTYTGAPPDEAYCRRTLSKDDVIVLVALQEASVVGGLVAYELDKLERARTSASDDGMASKRARGRCDKSIST